MNFDNKLNQQNSIYDKSIIDNNISEEKSRISVKDTNNKFTNNNIVEENIEKNLDKNYCINNIIANNDNVCSIISNKDNNNSNNTNNKHSHNLLSLSFLNEDLPNNISNLNTNIDKTNNIDNTYCNKNSKNIYNCRFCKKTYKNFNSFKSHLLKLHNKTIQSINELNEYELKIQKDDYIIEKSKNISKKNILNSKNLTRLNDNNAKNLIFLNNKNNKINYTCKKINTMNQSYYDHDNNLNYNIKDENTISNITKNILNFDYKSNNIFYNKLYNVKSAFSILNNSNKHKYYNSDINKIENIDKNLNFNNLYDKSNLLKSILFIKNTVNERNKFNLNFNNEKNLTNYEISSFSKTLAVSQFSFSKINLIRPSYGVESIKNLDNNTYFNKDKIHKHLRIKRLLCNYYKNINVDINNSTKNLNYLKNNNLNTLNNNTNNTQNNNQIEVFDLKDLIYNVVFNTEINLFVESFLNKIEKDTDTSKYY